MTPSRRMTFEWSNCPIIFASDRKVRFCFSEQPTFRVLMATGRSLLLGSFRHPLQTSPNSPAGDSKHSYVAAPISLLHVDTVACSYILVRPWGARGISVATGPWVCVSVSVSVNEWMWVWACVCESVSMGVSVCVWAWVCVWVCECVWVCVTVRVWVCMREREWKREGERNR